VTTDAAESGELFEEGMLRLPPCAIPDAMGRGACGLFSADAFVLELSDPDTVCALDMATTPLFYSALPRGGASHKTTATVRLLKLRAHVYNEYFNPG
jgi:hypothetical protein